MTSWSARWAAAWCLSCSLGSLTPGETWSGEIVLTVDDPVLAGTTISNRAVVPASSLDLEQTDNVATEGRGTCQAPIPRLVVVAPA